MTRNAAVGGLLAGLMLSACVCSALPGQTMSNGIVTVSINKSRYGASFSMTNRKTRESWLVDQPMFAWRFPDDRGNVSSLSGWKAVEVTRFRQPNGVSAARVLFCRSGAEVETTLQLYPGNGPLRASTSYRDTSPSPLPSPCESFCLELRPPGCVDFLRVKKGTTNPDCLRLCRDRINNGYSAAVLCSGSDERDDHDYFPWFCF